MTDNTDKNILSKENAELFDQVRQILKEEIEPQLNDHFGGAELTEITDDGVAYIKMTGACGTCPAAEDELQGTFGSIITERCPRITAVKLDRRVSEDILDFARQILSK